MGICDKCRNNVNNEYCKVCIELDGSFKKISPRQQGCGYINADVGRDDRLEHHYDPLKDKVNELVEKCNELQSQIDELKTKEVISP